VRFIFAFDWLPVPVFYVKTLRLAGQIKIYGIPVILIKEQYRDDVGLHYHELEHVEQFWRAFPFYYWKNRDNQSFRLKNEASAYARQLTYAPSDSNYNQFLVFLYNDYGFTMGRRKIRIIFDNVVARKG